MLKRETFLYFNFYFELISSILGVEEDLGTDCFNEQD